MISDAARTFWDLLRNSPKQVDLPIAQRRIAGERAEDAIAEPAGVFPEADVALDAIGAWILERTDRTSIA